MTFLAAVYRSQGRFAQAEQLYTRVLQGRRRVLGDGSPEALMTMGSLASLYLSLGSYSQAEPLVREALARYDKTAPDNWRRYESQSMLGAILTAQKNYDSAEALLLSGYRGMLEREATIRAFERVELGQAGKWIVQLYQDWGRQQKAAEWREKLQLRKPKFGAPAGIPRSRLQMEPRP